MAVQKFDARSALLRRQFHAEIGQLCAVADRRSGALRTRKINPERCDAGGSCESA
jgi:hypothetical protein